ncbi:MAG: hypothetical protein NVSMB27_30510 [Ktedonobacteraceae bacterium]
MDDMMIVQEEVSGKDAAHAMSEQIAIRADVAFADFAHNKVNISDVDAIIVDVTEVAFRAAKAALIHGVNELHTILPARVASKLHIKRCCRLQRR